MEKKFVAFSEEQLIELIRVHSKDKLISKDIELTERNLTADGGLRLFFNVKEVKPNK